MGAAAGVPMSAARAFPATRVERVFSDCFLERYNTCLRGGAAEPLYQPALSSSGQHVLYYREDHFASALHEVAHWCIAGEQRRRLPDFGYWYTPEGRNAEQQRAFAAAERKPQALEWFFSRACAYRFRVSMDNLELAHSVLLDTSMFERAVLTQAQAWQQDGLPARAAVFYAALCREFGTTIGSAQLDFGSTEFPA